MQRHDIPLRCRCGAVQGTALGINADIGNRAVCYCDDCQAFPRALGRGSDVLDVNGGTDIFQMPVDALVLTKGIDKVRCLRLTPKGTWRWYADCCKTPIGNTLGPAWPFVGVIHNFMALGTARDAMLGPVRGHVFTRFATGELTAEQRRLSDKPLFLIKSLLKVLRWKLQGHNKPSAFFNSNGQPLCEPTIVQADQ
jgi:hypothetical protein